eukprot:11945014-Prorocentrum_lima.AAC.1
MTPSIRSHADAFSGTHDATTCICADEAFPLLLRPQTTWVRSGSGRRCCTWWVLLLRALR